MFQVRVSFVKDVQKQEAMWERQHELAADKIYAMCSDLGGFFLKVVWAVNFHFFLISIGPFFPLSRTMNFAVKTVQFKWVFCLFLLSLLFNYIIDCFFCCFWLFLPVGNYKVFLCYFNWKKGDLLVCWDLIMFRLPPETLFYL